MAATQVMARLFKKIEVSENGCLTWMSAVSSKGYGQFWLNGRLVYAHRLVWELTHKAQIPDGMQIDHLCGNKRCVSPRHLEVVTPRTNVLRNDGPTAINARKTHCPRGHLLSGENLYVNPSRNRLCRTCKREIWDKGLTASHSRTEAIIAAIEATAAREEASRP